MDIKTDISAFAAQSRRLGAEQQSLKGSVAQHKRAGSSGLEGTYQQEFSSMAARERQLSNAMMLMQTARDLIQKAMEISNRLKNAASESMQGSADQNDVSNTLSEINSSLKEFGTSIVQPPVKVETAVHVQPHDVPSVAEEVEQLKKISADIALKKAEPGEIDRIIERLAEKQKHATEEIDRLSKNMGEHVHSIQPAAGFDAEHTGRKVISQIETQPLPALRAQGNIRHEVVGALVG